MNAQNFTSFIILLLGVAFINTIWAQQQQTKIYNIQFNKPYTLNETTEVINPGTPQQEIVVKGNRIVIYLVPSKNGTQYAFKELTSYTADRNGYRVKTSFELNLLDDLEDKLGVKTLKTSTG